VAPNRKPGPDDQMLKPMNLNDGTLPRTVTAVPGTISSQSLLATAVNVAIMFPLNGVSASPAKPATKQAKEEQVKGKEATGDPEIEALQLQGAAKTAASALKKAYPSVKFTSGRRNKAEQASAMAANVALNRKWIEQTYSHSTARYKCQKWVDDNPEKKTKGEISAGLKEVLDALTDAELGRLSKHLSGEAFDVKPQEKDAAEIKAMIKGFTDQAQKNGSTRAKFLEKEGGLVRWHAQF